ncbi:MAG: PAS domain S-box protein [Patescibacteria group bacterium]|nr:PAS domain S-box protein [Patescibacteria group bacterium]MDE2437921.1 PAS domain S-box protein [Patescibacteria group bacterium]
MSSFSGEYPIGFEQALDVLENSSEGFVIADGSRAHTILYVNPAWERITGWTKDEVIGKLSPRILKSGKQDAEFYDHMWGTILQGDIFTSEIVNKRKDGNLYDAEISIFPIRGTDNRVFYAEISRDITIKKKLEEDAKNRASLLKLEVELRTNELKNRILEDEAILMSLGEGLVVTDQNGLITLVNKAFEDLVGWTSEEAVGKNIFDVIPVEDEEGNGISTNDLPVFRVISGQGAPSIRSRYYYVRKDKTKFPTAVVTTLIRGGDIVKGVATIFRDITNELALEKAKDEFVSITSHQLRTPLSAIKWTLELFSKETDLSPKNQERVRDLYRSCEQLIDLVNTLLNIARIESGKLVAVKKKVNIVNLIHESLTLYKPAADKNGQNVLFTAPPHVEDVMCDPILFTQAFNNLLSNAIKYSPPHLTIKVILEKQEAQYRIMVHNEGSTIPETDYSKVFSKFYRSPDARYQETAGSGLGLFIAKSSVEKNGGIIGFESNVSKGTTFFFTIPSHE